MTSRNEKWYKKRLTLNILATISGLVLIIISPFHVCPLIALLSGLLGIFAGFPSEYILYRVYHRVQRDRK